jgi:hypothetical protein
LKKPHMHGGAEELARLRCEQSFATIEISAACEMRFVMNLWGLGARRDCFRVVAERDVRNLTGGSKACDDGQSIETHS